MTAITHSAQVYLDDFKRLSTTLSGPSWLAARRKEAIEAFESQGFPERTDEEWRFTPFAPLVQTPFHWALPPRITLSEEALRPWLLVPDSTAQLVFVNGLFAPALSQFRGLGGAVVSSIKEAYSVHSGLLERHLAQHAPYSQHPFVALNTAFIDDGALIYLPPETKQQQPIYLLFLSQASDEPQVSYPRVLVVADHGSEVTLVECYAGREGATLTNSVTEVVAMDASLIDHYRVNLEGPEALHVSYTHAAIYGDARFHSHSLTFGGTFVRNEVYAHLRGERGYCLLNGLYLGARKQVVDNHTTIDHATPYCESHEFYKGILFDEARGVFNGKIYVRPLAQKTDAKQTNQVLLLSRDAQIHTKPQLEIYADDVKCTHGATVGQLSKEALFYMRTRGLDESTARGLLTRGFAMDIINRVMLESLREALDRLFLQYLR